VSKCGMCGADPVELRAQVERLTREGSLLRSDIHGPGGLEARAEAAEAQVEALRKALLELEEALTVVSRSPYEGGCIRVNPSSEEVRTMMARLTAARAALAGSAGATTKEEGKP